jgi:hypothetical protein
MNILLKSENIIIMPKKGDCVLSGAAGKKKADLDKKFADIVSKVEEEAKKQWAASGIKTDEIAKKLVAEKDIIMGKATKLLNDFLKSDLEKTPPTPVMLEFSPDEDDFPAVEV